MLQLAILIVVVALVYWFLRIRRRGLFKRRPTPEKFVSQIKGEEIQVFLDYNTPIEWLQFDGLRFGQQFQYKTLEEISLPEGCNYITKPVSYNSNMVFQGQDLENLHEHNALGTLRPHEARLVRQTLLMVQQAVQNQQALTQVLENCDWEDLEPSLIEKLQSLVESAYRYQTSNKTDSPHPNPSPELSNP